MRDHGGNLDWAMGQWGGGPSDWVDLSTGINPEPYPVGTVSEHAWSALPTTSDVGRLIEAARGAYETEADVLPVAGAQAAIQMVPRLRAPGEMRVLGPTYNEHAASFAGQSWQVHMVSTLEELAGAEAAVVVNPNNPDGRTWMPMDLRDLAREVGMLVVDESFADPVPELSLVSDMPDNTLVLRSFGKFFGLAGLRLGFVLGGAENVAKLQAMSGPWPVSGAAIEIGEQALRDDHWARVTTVRLAEDCDWLDQLALARGFGLVGGTPLFRLYDTPDAATTQAGLARGRVWSRIFPYSSRWIRLGLVARALRPQVEGAFLAL